MCQCTLFDVGGVEIHSIECIEYCTKDQSNVEDVKDKVHHKGCTCYVMYDSMWKMGKEHTHTWLAHKLPKYLTDFQSENMFWKAET